MARLTTATMLEEKMNVLLDANGCCKHTCRTCPAGLGLMLPKPRRRVGPLRADPGRLDNQSLMRRIWPCPGREPKPRLEE
jgi:hypothetical protein